MSQFQRIDTDVHVRWPSDSTLLSRLPLSWQDRWHGGSGHTQAGLRIYPKYYNPYEPTSSLRTVSEQAVVSPGELISDWITPHALDAAVLSVYDAPLISTFGDIDYPIELARAVNSWMAEEWLDADERFYGSIVIASQDPVAAAAEIRRAATHPRMVQVMLPNGTRFPYGHRHYYPIYEAASDCGLALAIHAGTEGMGTSFPPTPSGWPGTVAEMRVTRSTTFLAHFTSLITEGVFVKFPDLRVIALETGVAWLPPYLWRFDKNYKALRSECPWLKELPSDYTRRFFRFGTQGAEPADPPSEFWRLLHSVGIDEYLIYSSNHPRWDTESPESSFILSSCPPELLDTIWAGAAQHTYPRMNDARALRL